MPYAYPFGHQRVPGSANRLFVGWGQTFVHAMDPWQLEFHVQAATEKHRAFTAQIPLARTASEWWRGRADFDGLRNSRAPLHRLPVFPYRPAVTRLTNPCRSTLRCSVAAPCLEQDACRARATMQTGAEPIPANPSRTRTGARRYPRASSFRLPPGVVLAGARRGNHLPAFAWPKLFFVPAVCVPRCDPGAGAQHRSWDARAFDRGAGASTLRHWPLRRREVSYGSLAPRSAARFSSSSPCARYRINRL